DHIKVAYLYLRRYSLDEAIVKIRSGLQALAVAWSAPVGDLEKGYHETMTQAWIRLVHLALGDGSDAKNADDFCDRQPTLMQKTRPQSFYSRERLMSWEAKRESSSLTWRSFMRQRLKIKSRRDFLNRNPII